MFRTRAALSALLIGVLVLSGTAAPAQTPARTTPAAAPSGAAGTIAAIRVEGNQRIEAATVRSYMLVQPGDPFNSDQLDRSLKTLYATGLFSDVRLVREGNTLMVHVVENPIVNRIAFEGNRKLNDDQLRGQLQLRPRSVFTPAIAQADRQHLLNLYAHSGRFAARVDAKIVKLPQNRVNVVFEINEGPTTLVSPHRLRRQPRIQREPAARGDRKPRGAVVALPVHLGQLRSASAWISTRSCCAASTSRTVTPTSRLSMPVPSWRRTVRRSSSPSRSARASATAWPRSP